MQIEERAAGDVTILDLKAQMIARWSGDEILKDKINKPRDSRPQALVLNLADVPYIDSAGLGEVVRVPYTTVKRQGGNIAVAST
jgi:anti-anti-sigma factor